MESESGDASKSNSESAGETVPVDPGTVALDNVSEEKDAAAKNPPKRSLPLQKYRQDKAAALESACEADAPEATDPADEAPADASTPAPADVVPRPEIAVPPAAPELAVPLPPVTASPGATPADVAAPDVPIDALPDAPVLTGPAAAVATAAAAAIAAVEATTTSTKKRTSTPGSTAKKAKKPRKDPYKILANKEVSWNDMYYALTVERLKNGGVCPLRVDSKTPLGKWMAHQRALYAKMIKNGHTSEGELTEDRIEVLNSIGFIWDTYERELNQKWQQRFEELCAYKELHGHCNVPQKDPNLGNWVKMQRENKRHGDLKAAGKAGAASRRVCLRPEHKAKLESIGFEFFVGKKVTGWDKRYEQLLEYRSENGHCNVPQSYPPDKAFGRWVMKQRCEYSQRLRGIRSQMTDERIAKLNEIGFSWVSPNFKGKKKEDMMGLPDQPDQLQEEAPQQELPEQEHPQQVHPQQEHPQQVHPQQEQPDLSGTQDSVHV